MDNDWKERLGVVFSTNPNFEYDNGQKEEPQTLPKERQQLHVYFERAGRKGKTVTLIDGFIGTKDDLKTLEKLLKSRCGTGGSSKDGQIVIQGNLVEKIKEILLKEGYKTK